MEVWLTIQDLNPNCFLQRETCYRYTNGQFGDAGEIRTLIIQLYAKSLGNFANTASISRSIIFFFHSKLTNTTISNALIYAYH